jgi:hypothetical protein
MGFELPRRKDAKFFKWVLGFFAPWRFKLVFEGCRWIIGFSFWVGWGSVRLFSGAVRWDN